MPIYLGETPWHGVSSHRQPPYCLTLQFVLNYIINIRRNKERNRCLMNTSKSGLAERGDQVLAPVLGHYTRLAVSHGQGMFLYGLDGKKYLDFAAGIATAATGHCHPAVTKAICTQSQKLIHAGAGVVYYEPHIRLAEKLATLTPFPQAKTFFTNSGSEAVESALKLARHVSKKPKLVAFQGGFHGRTFGALSLTSSKLKYQQGYAPLLPDTHIIAPELAALAALGPENIAAVLIEPIQGEGGYLPVSKEFLTALRQFCAAHHILLILDEIQTGIGRTGTWFACEHYDLQPDILILAKGLASGFPLGALVADATLLDQWPTGAHGGTYTGNPIACAAGLATLATIANENLLENATKLGQYLRPKLARLQQATTLIKDVRGLGLMWGLEFASGQLVQTIRSQCLAQGLLLISCGSQDQVIRLAPPLIVTQAQVDEALNILTRVLKTLCTQNTTN
jgi:4-aminobutyrate aminotransferase